jgi:hypothetical protein
LFACPGMCGAFVGAEWRWAPLPGLHGRPVMSRAAFQLLEVLVQDLLQIDRVLDAGNDGFD